jgi:MFS superfamily sulfate permease-like transporter
MGYGGALDGNLATVAAIFCNFLHHHWTSQILGGSHCRTLAMHPATIGRHYHLPSPGTLIVVAPLHNISHMIDRLHEIESSAFFIPPP